MSPNYKRKIFVWLIALPDANPVLSWLGTSIARSLVEFKNLNLLIINKLNKYGNPSQSVITALKKFPARHHSMQINYKIGNYLLEFWDHKKYRININRVMNSYSPEISCTWNRNINFGYYIHFLLWKWQYLLPVMNIASLTGYWYLLNNERLWATPLI